jgi:hypothetical protein
MSLGIFHRFWSSWDCFLNLAVFDHLSHSSDSLLHRHLSNFDLLLSLRFEFLLAIFTLALWMEPLKRICHIQIHAFLTSSLRDNVLHLGPIRLVELDLHRFESYACFSDSAIAIAKDDLADGDGAALFVLRFRDDVCGEKSAANKVLSRADFALETAPDLGDGELEVGRGGIDGCGVGDVVRGCQLCHFVAVERVCFESALRSEGQSRLQTCERAELERWSGLEIGSRRRG